MRNNRFMPVLAALAAALALGVAACGDDGEETGGSASAGESNQELSGAIRIDKKHPPPMVFVLAA